MKAETEEDDEHGLEVRQEKLESSWVSQAVREGRRGVLKKGTVKRIEKLMKEYSVIFDVLRDDGQTFAWELFANEARFTKIGLGGGHRNAMPADLSTGVNFNDEKVQKEWLYLIEYWQPFIVTCAFPCKPHSQMQQLNREQGLGAQVDELLEETETLLQFTRKVLDLQYAGDRIGIAENPWATDAWKHPALYPLFIHEGSAYKGSNWISVCTASWTTRTKRSRSRQACWYRVVPDSRGGSIGCATDDTSTPRRSEEDRGTWSRREYGQPSWRGHW